MKLGTQKLHTNMNIKNRFCFIIPQLIKKFWDYLSTQFLKFHHRETLSANYRR